MDDLTHLQPTGAKEGPTQDDFIFIGGIEMTVADFVAVWNGEIILPLLSPREINEACRLRHTSRGVHDDPFNDELEHGWLFALSGFTEKTERRLRQKKFKDIKKLIDRYRSEGQPLGVLDMDRVLAVLSSGEVRFNNVTQFVARYAEPVESEALVVREAARESHEIDGAPHVETRYIDNSSAYPLDSLTEDVKQALRDYLGITESGLRLIPVVILERVLAGHELTDDDLRELSNIRDIGSTKLIYILQKTREALFGVGVLAMAVAVNSESIIRNPELFYYLLHGGMGMGTVGAASFFVPLSYLKPRVKLASSVRRYRALERGLRRSLAQLCENPIGRVRAMLVQEMIKGTYELSANANVPRLQAFVNALDANREAEAEFNAMCSSIDRSMDQVAGVLEAIHDFEEARGELGEKASLKELGPAAGDGDAK